MNLSQFTSLVQIPNEQEWGTHFLPALAKYEINTPLRQSYFFAQILHESMGLTQVEENLNYSAKRLVEVFPKYFANIGVAHRYAHQPEKIANRVYANRMKNGNEWSGDGYKFRGRGPLQITGKSNYTAVSKTLLGDDSFVDDPDLLLLPKWGAMAACWWWDNAGCNQLADDRLFKAVTRRVNGALNGYSDRLKWLARIRALA
ncbi:putative chitinase [Cnuella takakiae]|uniref:Putative chitinase n=1 Tax=Cnuella takakiae TaxID=1302690 RepID=A0A1M4VRU7_9BACT|nr:glycoside hydrolase family 19 protein [Cnuella takakiae]OLY92523.1 hypothetical protein BUE76_11945 [Cnuella takakiae]SHE71570.1 putative chitinase [Cnuella takakiae]